MATFPNIPAEWLPSQLMRRASTAVEAMESCFVSAGLARCNLPHQAGTHSGKSPMPRIFVSHAQADKPIVEAFTSFIRSAHDLSQQDVFVSCVDGLGIPNGEKFNEYIVANLKDAEVTIVLLSPNFMASKFCNNELGAILALEKPVLFMVIPPAKFSDMKGMVEGHQADKIDNESDLAKFRDSLDRLLDNPPKSTPIWESGRAIFLESLAKALPTIPPPALVELAKYQELQKQVESLQQAMNEVVAAQNKLTAELDQVKQLKDKDEVRKVEQQNSTEEQSFEQLRTVARHALSSFSSVVREALFRQYRREDYEPDEIVLCQTDLDNGRLTKDTFGNIRANNNDPKIKKAIGFGIQCRTASTPPALPGRPASEPVPAAETAPMPETPPAEPIPPEPVPTEPNPETPVIPPAFDATTIGFAPEETIERSGQRDQ